MESPNKTTISVIIPAYNISKYISECLDSVLTQSFDGLEVICIDDRSSDNTRALLMEYAEKDDRVRVIAFDENQGLSAVRNAGIEAASGEYILFLDGDDLLADGSLQLLSETVQENELDLLFFDRVKICDIPGQPVQQPALREKTANQIMSGPALMELQIKEGEYNTSAVFNIVRTELLRKSGLRFFPGIIHEDELYTPLVTVLAQRAMYINSKLYIHRVRGNSIMTTAISRRNVEGYFVAATELMSHFLDSGCRYSGLEMRAKLVFYSAMNKYRQLSDEEKALTGKSLPEPYHYLFESFTSQMERVEKRNQMQIRKIDALQKQNAALEASLSYRVGRVITYLPKKAYGFFRCCRENGIVYSVRYVFRKIFSKE